MNGEHPQNEELIFRTWRKADCCHACKHWRPCSSSSLEALGECRCTFNSGLWAWEVCDNFERIAEDEAKETDE